MTSMPFTARVGLAALLLGAPLAPLSGQEEDAAPEWDVTEARGATRAVGAGPSGATGRPTESRAHAFPAAVNRDAGETLGEGWRIGRPLLPSAPDVMTRSRPAFVCLAALAAFFTLACGDDGTGPGGVEVIEDVTFDASLGIDLSQMTRTGTGLYYQDLAEGEGELARTGDRVEVRYALWLRDGRQMDAGVFPFVLGSGQVIPGFDQGVEGMKEGGIRKILVPSSLGYGTRGQGSIPGGAILIFEIELLSVTTG